MFKKKVALRSPHTINLGLQKGGPVQGLTVGKLHVISANVFFVNTKKKVECLKPCPRISQLLNHRQWKIDGWYLLLVKLNELDATRN